MSRPSIQRGAGEVLEILAARVKVLRLAVGEASSELRPNFCPHCRRARMILDMACDAPRLPGPRGSLE